MKVTAVIAEYNPFHNGHFYQLDTIRQTLNTDIIIVVMSGDFMQRGIPAIVNKYKRCNMALANGADLVFELPVYFALGSAEYFAKGAVSLLDKLGVVDMLHFGSEAGDISLLYEFANMALSHETRTYKTVLNNYLRKGDSFPAARDHALSELFPNEAVSKLIHAPNNILGLEYIKALIQRNSAIKPTTFPRKGEGYASDTLSSDNFASANAIRNALYNQTAEHSTEDAIKKQMPSSVYALLQQNTLLETNDFSEVLSYKMLEKKMLQSKMPQNHNPKDAFADYYDIGKQLSHTLYNNLPHFASFEDFALLCKTKNLTYSRICRGLMHILLDMTQDSADALKRDDYALYARLLGFTDHGKQLLKSIKANASIPVITKLSSARKQLDGTALMSLQSDIHAADIYDSVQYQKQLRYNALSPQNQNQLRHNTTSGQTFRHNELTSQINRVRV